MSCEIYANIILKGYSFKKNSWDNLMATLITMADFASEWLSHIASITFFDQNIQVLFA